jgi:hypothetical protein
MIHNNDIIYISFNNLQFGAGRTNLIIKIQNIILFNAFFNLYPTNKAIFIKYNVEYKVK